MSSDSGGSQRRTVAGNAEVIERAVRDMEALERRVDAAMESSERVRRRVFEGNGEPSIILTIARIQDQFGGRIQDLTRRVEELESDRKRLIGMVIGAIVAAAMALLLKGQPPG